jgi:hypothetical protein
VVVVVGLQLRSQVQMALQGRQGEVADVALVKVVAGQRRRNEVGTVEGITSVSKDASTHLPVKRLGREPEASRFADADADNILDFWASFTLRVLRGERGAGTSTGFAREGAAAVELSCTRHAFKCHRHPPQLALLDLPVQGHMRALISKFKLRSLFVAHPRPDDRDALRCF